MTIRNECMYIRFDMEGDEECFKRMLPRVPYLSIEFFETLSLSLETPPLYSDSVYRQAERRCLSAHDSHYTATLHLNEKLVFEWMRSLPIERVLPSSSSRRILIKKKKITNSLPSVSSSSLSFPSSILFSREFIITRSN